MVRTAGPGDKPKIIEMAVRFILSTSYRAIIRLVPEVLDNLVDVLLEHGTILVYEEEGELVGMLAASALPSPYSGETEGIEVVWWVDQEHRRMLAGPKLLRSFESWARQKGIRVVKMGAPVGSDVGRFLEHLGYEAVETAYMKTL